MSISCFLLEKTLQKCLKVELGFFDANFFSILNFVGALLWLASVWASNSKFWREELSNADCECQAPFFQCGGVIPIWAQECNKFCFLKFQAGSPPAWNSTGVDIQFGGCHYIAPNDEEMLFRIFLAFLTSLLFPPPRFFLVISSWKSARLRSWWPQSGEPKSCESLLGTVASP